MSKAAVIGVEILRQTLSVGTTRNTRVINACMTTQTTLQYDN